MPQHELATDGPPPEAPETTGLMNLTFSATGLGNTFTPDESDLAGSVTYSHDRMTQLVAELFRRVGELGANAKRVNDRVQALPGRDEYEAILADVAALQQQVGGIYTELQVIRQSQLALTRSMQSVLQILPYAKAS